MEKQSIFENIYCHRRNLEKINSQIDYLFHSMQVIPQELLDERQEIVKNIEDLEEKLNVKPVKKTDQTKLDL